MIVKREGLIKSSFALYQAERRREVATPWLRPNRTVLLMSHASTSRRPVAYLTISWTACSTAARLLLWRLLVSEDRFAVDFEVASVSRLPGRHLTAVNGFGEEQNIDRAGAAGGDFDD